MGVSHKKKKMKKRHEMINFMTINRPTLGPKVA